MRRLALALLAALFALTPAVAAAGPRPVSVVGWAAIDIAEPVTSFDFRVHASGDGRSGTGVIWLSHYNQSRIGWAVARVDCVRRMGSTVVATGTVSDAQDWAAGAPGDAVAISVREGSPDVIAFGSGERVVRCAGPRPEQGVSRGDFTITTGSGETTG